MYCFIEPVVKSKLCPECGLCEYDNCYNLSYRCRQAHGGGDREAVATAMEQGTGLPL